MLVYLIRLASVLTGRLLLYKLLKKSTLEQKESIEMESRLKMARKKKGYTQVQLAKLMGVDPNQISHWECGRATPIRSHGMNLH